MEKQKEIEEAAEKVTQRLPRQTLADANASLLVSPPKKDEEKLKPATLQKKPEPTSPISAGMFDDNEEDPRKLGSILQTTVDVNLEEAAARVKTGTFRPLITPKGAKGGFAMPEGNGGRARTGTT